VESCPLPMLVRLLARSGPGLPPVEVSGPGYRPQVALFAPEVGGCAVLAEPVRFTGIPAHTAVGVEVSDRHYAWALPAVEAVDVPEGAEVLIPAGALRVCCRSGPPTATGRAVDGGPPAPAGGAPIGGVPGVGAGLGGGASARSQADTHG
jgi:hypothetical protein